MPLYWSKIAGAPILHRRIRSAPTSVPTLALVIHTNGVVMRQTIYMAILQLARRP